MDEGVHGFNVSLITTVHSTTDFVTFMKPLNPFWPEPIAASPGEEDQVLVDARPVVFWDPSEYLPACF